MSKTDMETLGEIIKKAIKEKGLKESVIALKMGISRQSLNQIDTRKTFDLEWLNRFKEASGLDFTNYFSQKINKIYDDNQIPLSSFGEPENDFVKMSITVNISSHADRIEKITDLIRFINGEATKLGFIII